MQHMSAMVPLCVPIELQRSYAPSGAASGGGLRYFRLAVGLEAGGQYPRSLRLRSPVPEELCDGPLRARFHLPPPTESIAKLIGAAWEGEVVLTAEAGEVVIDAGSERERREARLLHFLQIDPATRERLRLYATLRLQAF